MLLMIDNYDSFTYNLVQYFGELGEDVRVVRNDAADVAALAAMKPERVCVSPGPCSPKEAGVSLEAIKYFAGKVPVLGVCLGHQAIGEAFGGKIVRAKRLMHGKTDVITADGKGVFAGLPEKITVARAMPPPSPSSWARTSAPASRPCCPPWAPTKTPAGPPWCT